jgi:hypothetical protein
VDARPARCGNVGIVAAPHHHQLTSDVSDTNEAIGLTAAKLVVVNAGAIEACRGHDIASQRRTPSEMTTKTEAHRKGQWSHERLLSAPPNHGRNVFISSVDASLGGAGQGRISVVVEIQHRSCRQQPRPWFWTDHNIAVTSESTHDPDVSRRVAEDVSEAQHQWMSTITVGPSDNAANDATGTLGINFVELDSHYWLPMAVPRRTLSSACSSLAANNTNSLTFWVNDNGTVD